MRTMATILEDPVIATVPSTLAQVQRDILPVLRTLADTNERVAFIAGSTERIMTFVDDTSRTIAGLPGAALLGRRKPSTPREP
jgi:ABC-type sulfate transport system permease subunit